MRYLRMYIGGESGEPGITLYEIDARGRVHRQVQIQAECSLFAPEDILMRQPVNTDYMILHPAAEEIDQIDFETLWGEVDDSREFRRRIPDADLPWDGTLEHNKKQYRMRWRPDARAMRGWSVVPGFVSLFIEGDAEVAWKAYAAVFLESRIRWSAPYEQAA